MQVYTDVHTSPHVAIPSWTPSTRFILEETKLHSSKYEKWIDMCLSSIEGDVYFLVDDVIFLKMLEIYITKHHHTQVCMLDGIVHDSSESLHCHFASIFQRMEDLGSEIY